MIVYVGEYVVLKTPQGVMIMHTEDYKKKSKEQSAVIKYDGTLNQAVDKLMKQQFGRKI